MGVSSQLYAYHMDGTLYDRFPISYEFSFTSTPLIADLDNDNDLEIILGSSGSLVSIDVMESGYLNEFGSPYWSQDRGNALKTGFYEKENLECLAPTEGDLNCDSFVDVLDILLLVQTAVSSDDISNYEMWVSDMNQDGIIDVLDVIIIVNLIIN